MTERELEGGRRKVRGDVVVLVSSNGCKLRGSREGGTGTVNAVA